MKTLLRILTHRSVQVVMLLLLLAGAVYLRLQDSPALGRLELITPDYFNRLMPRQPYDDVRIVDIDEDSLAKIGQWPWPRTVLGDLVVTLKQMGAKVVVFDMVFSEPDRTSPARIAKNLPDTPEMGPVRATLEGLRDNDEEFARKISEAGNVVTGFVNATRRTGMMVPPPKAEFYDGGMKSPRPQALAPYYKEYVVTLPVLTQAAAGNGSFSAAPEHDGVLRKVPLLVASSDRVFPALSLEAIRVALGRDSYQIKVEGDPMVPSRPGIHSINVGGNLIPTDEDGRIRVYYAGHRKAIYVPLWQVLQHQVSPDTFKDKIVMVGTSSIGLLDIRSSPLATVLPGVEIHAEIIEQILHKQFLQRPFFVEVGEIVSTVAVSLCIIFLAPFIGAGTLAALVALLVAIGNVGALYAYKTYGFILAPIYPSLTIIVIFILSSILTNLRSEMERRAVRTAFGHYISPALLEELTKDPSKLKLGGEVREMSVMFTDIRNFTTIAEQMEPGELIKMMNDFLTPMTACVMDNRGTVDKYMGDAMMVFWNAPLYDPDHAKHACKSAIEMLDALGAVNTELKARLGPRYRELKAGIGINTGKCSVGNMGSKQRFAYSALGDTVNLASRLEGQTKGYGVSVLISEGTRKAAPGFAAIEIDLLTVKGRTEPERVFTLLGSAETPDFKEFTALHNRMLKAYRARAWAEALDLGARCAEMRPELAGLYALYATRIADYKTAPPPEGWAGVWVAKDK